MCCGWLYISRCVCGRDAAAMYGWVAGACSLLQKLPQIYLVYCRKSARDISGWMLGVQVVGLVLYVIHAWQIDDPPLLYACVGILAQCAVLVGQKAWYHRRGLGDERRAHPGAERRAHLGDGRETRPGEGAGHVRHLVVGNGRLGEGPGGGVQRVA